MADGSVVIGVALDTSAFLASVNGLEGQMTEMGNRMNALLGASFSGGGWSEQAAAAMAGVSATMLAMTAELGAEMKATADHAIASFTGAGWQSAGAQASLGIAGGITAGSGQVSGAISALASRLTEAFRGGDWGAIGANMMAGVAGGIASAGAEVIAAIRQVSAEASEAIKDFYGIQSPSALMRDEVGVMISRGIAEGILDGASFVRSAAAEVGSAVNVTGHSGTRESGGNSHSVTQNIYLRDTDASPYRTARRIRKESEAMFRL